MLPIRYGVTVDEASISTGSSKVSEAAVGRRRSGEPIASLLYKEGVIR